MAVPEKCINRANQIGAVITASGETGLTAMGRPHSDGLLVIVNRDKQPAVTVDIGIDGCLISTVVHTPENKPIAEKIKEIFECDCPTNYRELDIDSTIIAESKAVSVEAFEHYLSLLETDSGQQADIMKRVREKLQLEIPEMQQEIIHVLGHGKSIEFHTMLRKLTYAVSTVTSVLMLRFLIDTITEMEIEHGRSDTANSGTSGKNVGDAGGTDNESETAVGGESSAEEKVQDGENVDGSGAESVPSGS